MVIDDFRTLTRFSADGLSKVSLFESHRLFADLYCLQPGQTQRVHAHADNDKIYVVLDGVAVVQLGTTEHRVVAGGMAIAPAGVPHGVHNDSEHGTTLLVVMAPHPKPPTPSAS